MRCFSLLKVSKHFYLKMPTEILFWEISTWLLYLGSTPERPCKFLHVIHKVVQVWELIIAVIPLSDQNLTALLKTTATI